MRTTAVTAFAMFLAFTTIHAQLREVNLEAIQGQIDADRAQSASAGFR